MKNKRWNKRLTDCTEENVKEAEDKTQDRETKEQYWYEK